MAEPDVPHHLSPVHGNERPTGMSPADHLVPQIRDLGVVPERRGDDFVDRRRVRGGSGADRERAHAASVDWMRG
jgi:hypothetical protein